MVKHDVGYWMQTHRCINIILAVSHVLVYIWVGILATVATDIGGHQHSNIQHLFLESAVFLPDNVSRHCFVVYHKVAIWGAQINNSGTTNDWSEIETRQKGRICWCNYATDFYRHRGVLQDHREPRQTNKCTHCQELTSCWRYVRSMSICWPTSYST